MRVREQHGLIVRIGGQLAQKLPCERHVRRAAADACEHGAQLRAVAACRAVRHGNAVPREIRVPLDAPRIRLIGPVIREQERPKRHFSLIKVPCRGRGLRRELAKPLRKCDRLHRLRLGDQAAAAVLGEQRCTVCRQRILPRVAAAAELIDFAVTVRVARNPGADVVKILPRPVAGRHGNALVLEQALVDAHQCRHALIWQRILHAVLRTALQRGGIEIRVGDLFILCETAVQRRQCTELAQRSEILRQHEKYIRFTAEQILVDEPFRVIPFEDTARVGDMHVRVLPLEPLDSRVNDGIAVPVRRVPVAARHKAEPQLDRTRAAVHRRRQAHRRQQRGRRQALCKPLHSGPPNGRPATPVCTAQMASCVRSRRSSLLRMLLR